jgi:hypothetical protein
MFDAVNGLARDPYEPALVAPTHEAKGDPVAAAATAAHDVLVALAPARTAEYDARLAQDLAGVQAPGQSRHGARWGADVAAAVLAARAGDGFAGTETQPAVLAVGQYRGSWNAQPRHLAPFAIDDPSAYVGDGPPALGSTAYAAAFDDVRLAGDARVDDPTALATFRFWQLAGGSVQPPGAWLQVAVSVSEARELPLLETARLFALESMALADTVAPTFETKHRFHSWRPETAIVEAADDGNDATAPDQGWRPRGGSSGSPEHWSGHSSFSAAGATVLAGFFCADDVPFTLTSAGATRTFPSFSAAAAEAGRSRVLGGLHFEFSNQAGLEAGRLVAGEVLDTALLPADGDAPACPA